MDDLSVCLDQIALSGLEGCTVEELWEHLSRADPPVALNDQTKDFIWSQITQCLSVVNFYQLDDPKLGDYPVTKIQVSGFSTKEWNIFTPPAPFSPVNDDIRGSCVSFNARKDITSEIKNLNRDERKLPNILERYGSNRVVLVGSPDLRVKSLTPPHSDPTLITSMNNIRYGLLEVVGQSRGCGIFRTAVTKHYLKVDSRTTFFHVKVLNKAGLITIKTIRTSTNGRSMFTLFLKRFEPFTLSVSNEQRMCDLLSNSPNQTLPTQYLLQTLKKSYKPTRASLLSKGVIESVNILKADRWLDYPESAKGVKLIHPYTPDQSLDDTLVKEEGLMGGNIEDDDDYDEGVEPSIGTQPIVAELPLQTQAYHLIDSFGAEGIPFPIFLKSMKVDKYTLRILSKPLLASSSIVKVLMDTAAIRTSKLISTRHSAMSDEVVAIQSQLAQQKGGPNIQVENLVITGKSAARFHSPKQNKIVQIKEKDNQESEPHTGQSQSDTTNIVSSDQQLEEVNTEAKPHPLPVAMETDASNDVSIHHPLSIRQLKRINMLNQYMEQKRVENGHVGMIKFIKEEELKEGRTAVMDRKTTLKLLQYMCQTNQLMIKKREIDLGGLSMEIKLYCIPTVSEEEIQEADKAAENWYQKVLYRRETRPKTDSSVDRKPYIRTVKKKKKKKSLLDDGGESSSDEEEMYEGNTNDEDGGEDGGNMEQDIKREAKPITSVSKFQRIKNFHYYLWILAHGCSKITDMNEDGCGSNDTTEDDPYLLPELHYPWAKHVHQLSSCKRDGRVSYSDILYNMPLSLFFTLKKINNSIISKYHEYFLDPKLSHTKLSELPKKLRMIIARKQYDVVCINFLVDQLVQLKLVERNQGMTPDKSKLQVKLCNNAIILETHACKPRRTFFLEEARSTFSTIECPLHSLEELEMFWYKLHGVCMATPIIIGARRKTSHKIVITDEYPLPYNRDISRFKEKSVEFDSQGFGAGGLAPLMFSHLSKNWVQSLPDFLTEGELKLGEFIQTQPGSDSYGPGMSLGIIPEVSLQSEDEDTRPLRKRPHPFDTLLNSAEFVRTKRQKFETVIKPSTSITTRSGGKGFQRVRAKQVLKKAMKLKRSKERESKASLISLMVKKNTSAEIDKQALMRRVGKRSIWFPHEDNFLLLGYIASRVYLLMYKSPVDICLLSNALHNKFETSKGKTSDSIRRRLIFLLKKKSYCATIAAYVEEILHELRLLDTEEQQTFKSILDFVSQRYKSHDGHMISIDCIDLPLSVSELHEKYEVNLKTTELGSVSVDDQSSDNQELLSTLIIMCLSVDQSSYDPYSIFKQLENYPKHDLILAVERLKNALYIKQKKSLGIPSHRGPLQTQGFELSVSFHTKLEAHYSQGFPEELIEAATMLDNWRNELANSRVEGPIVLNTGDVNGGTVATVVHELFDIDNPVKNSITCEPKFPSELFFNSTGGQTLKSVLEQGKDDDDIEGDEDIERGFEPSDLDDQRLQDIRESDGGEGETTPIIDPPSASDTTSNLPKCGISSMLQVDEFAELQHCQVEFGPSLNIGEFEDPVKGAGVIDDDNHDRDAPDEVTFNEFTDIVKNLGYNEDDLQLAEKVFKRITMSEQKGIRENELLQSFDNDSIRTGNKTVQDILCDLLNFKLVYSVGIATPLIISHAHSTRWMLNDIHGNKLGGLLPWTSVGSGDINIPLLTKLERKVVSHIVTNPGVSLESLLVKFKYLFTKFSLLKLLKSLQLSGHVTGHAMKTTPTSAQTNLFSPRPITYLTGYHDDDDPSLVFFKATLQADFISLK